MKKLTFIGLVLIMVMLFGFAQKEEDLEVARTQDYIAATTKQGAEKIKALTDYIKKFPDVKQKWTRYAYYSLATEHFQTKNYSEAVKYAKRTLEIGVPGEGGEEGRLYLILGNCYGIKDTPLFNNEEALKFTNQAISVATQKNLDDVLGEAKKLKDKLSGPPPVHLTPEQKIKRFYSNAEYAEAISFYKSLGAGEKANEEIHKTYAAALLKQKNYEAALTEFKALSTAHKKGIYASYLGEVYENKAKSDKKFYDSAVAHYLEAHLLFKKEQNNTTSQTAFKNARYDLYEKYGFNKKVEEYNKKQTQNQSSAQKNKAEIERLKKELAKHERYLRKTYDRNDMDPPDYELAKSQKLEDKIAALEKGGTTDSAGGDEGAKLETERTKIEKELNDLLAAAKKRLGL
ncbi:MAG: tetratricopeptide repeat protein [Candidatus Aminicenantes bacterium]|nr:tetratricopeptide repeat protein [Candidatus Aminicenantes bacterium]